MAASIQKHILPALIVALLLLGYAARATAQLTLICPANDPPHFGQVGAPYSSALVATGGVSPYTFSIVGGPLPAGLSLNSSTGAITGTPTLAVSLNFTAQVMDSSGNPPTNITVATCGITILPAPLTLACPANITFAGAPYSSALIASGGVSPYTYSLAAGSSLPSGLMLNSSTGAITGTQTTPGTYSFVAMVNDSAGNPAQASCMITVTPAMSTLTCPANSGQVGVAYSSALVVMTGGPPPYTFSIVGGPLPAGLSLNPSTGAITGTPTTAGSFGFTATVTGPNINGSTTPSCTITVTPPNTNHCTYSWGFYKNHDSVVASLIARGGPLTIGSVSYHFEEIEGILAQPVAGNGLVSLAHQLIAAELNIRGGSVAPNSVGMAITEANMIIGSMNVPGSGNKPDGYLSPGKTSGLETTLDSFNEGVLGSGSCD
jgi:hypothetical protein